MAREPTAHEAYLSTVAQLVAEGDVQALEQPAYKLWLQAKSEGYRGLCVKLGPFGRLSVTIPIPLDEKDASLVGVRGMSEEEQEAAFVAFLNQLAKVVRAHGIALPAATRNNGRGSPTQSESPNQFSTPARNSPKGSSPKGSSPKHSSSPTRSSRRRRSP